MQDFVHQQYQAKFPSSGWDFQDNQLSNTVRKECHRRFCLGTGLDLEVGKVGMNIELLHCCFTHQDPSEGWDAPKKLISLIAGKRFQFFLMIFTFHTVDGKNSCTTWDV